MPQMPNSAALRKIGYCAWVKGGYGSSISIGLEGREDLLVFIWPIMSA